MYAVMFWRFPIWYFFESYSEWIDMYFRLRWFSSSDSFPVLLIDSTFLLCYLFVAIFCSKIVLFPCHLVDGMCWSIHPLLTGSFFFFVVLECSAFFVLFSFFDIFLVFLHSPVPSGLFPRDFCFICCCFFLSQAFSLSYLFCLLS